MTGTRTASPALHASIAVFTLVVGLAASALTVKMFTLALAATEQDAAVRAAMAGVGALFVAAEMGAFAVRGLLPRQMKTARRALLVLGIALMGFEVATIYVTQTSLAATAQAAALARAGQIEAIQKGIASAREAAATLRATATADESSKFSWVRARVAGELQQAAAVEQPVAAQVQHLAVLQAQAAPTLKDTLGHTGQVIYIMGRAILMTAIGAIMFSIFGAILPRRQAAEAAPVESPAPEVTAPELPSMDTDAERFEAVWRAIEAGECKPSLRAIYAFCGASQAVAQRYIKALETAGVLKRAGQGYVVRPARPKLRVIAA